jgi:hypothetical protein
VNVALIAEQPFEGILKRRARHSMLCGKPAACRSLSIGERDENDPLCPPEPIPDGLVRVACLAQRQVDRGEKWVPSIRPCVEEVVEVVRKEDGSLRMTSSERKQLVHRFAGIEAVRGQKRFDVIGGLIDWQRRQLQRSRLTVERALPIGEQRSHQRWLAAREHIGRGASVVLND